MRLRIARKMSQSTKKWSKISQNGQNSWEWCWGQPGKWASLQKNGHKLAKIAKTAENFQKIPDCVPRRNWAHILIVGNFLCWGSAHHYKKWPKKCPKNAQKMPKKCPKISQIGRKTAKIVPWWNWAHILVVWSFLCQGSRLSKKIGTTISQNG